MNILITRVCGFIGFHVVERLVIKGFNVSDFTFYNSRSVNGLIYELKNFLIQITQCFILNIFVENNNIISNLDK